MRKGRKGRKERKDRKGKEGQEGGRERSGQELAGTVRDPWVREIGDAHLLLCEGRDSKSVKAGERRNDSNGRSSRSFD
jgi:hypothetical protein